MAASPLWVSEELEYWDSGTRFTHIAATHSELVAVSAQGQLHQWRWADAHPYQRNDVSGWWKVKGDWIRDGLRLRFLVIFKCRKFYKCRAYISTALHKLICVYP